MARLGKRERAAKAAIIKGNLANMGNLERPTQVKRHKDGTLSVVSGSTMGSRMHVTNLMRHTHTMGAHVGHNNKGSEDKRKGSKRWGAH